MCIVLGNSGIQIREEDIIRLWIKTKKSRGKGKPRFFLTSTDQITGYEQELVEFDDYTKASEALYKVVTALDERRSRLELY